MTRIAAALACLVLLVTVLPAAADPTAQFWEELGGSASGNGLSAATTGVPTGNRQVSVAVGPDGRPVVAYADGDTIRVRRWTGAAWELIGPSGASGGLPQLVTDANGRMYLAWRQFAGATSSWEIFLRARDWNGTTWDELGGSGSGGGITGHEGAAGVPVFSLALAPDGTPYLAYQSTTFAEADFTTVTGGLHAWTNQIFVRRWDGTAWAFLGSGREGGGASNAFSFKVSGHGTTTFVSHNGEHPTLAIGADNRPVVAFIYSSFFEGGNPPEFNGENDDLYAVRWSGAAWEPLGPPTPATLDNVALGAPGGISNSPGWIREVSHDRLVRPSIMVDRDGVIILAWGETNFDDGFRYIYVYKFTGAGWTGYASPSGQIDKIAFAYDTALAQGVHGPIVVWPRGGGDQSWVAVMEYVPGEGRFMSLGDGSVSPGISVPGDRAFNPRVAVTSAGIPTVAWIDLTPPVPQAFLRTYSESVGPDLNISSVTAPSSTQPGQSMTVTAIVRNGGNAAAPASSVSFYFGSGTEHAAGDTALGSRDVSALGVGAGASVDLTFSVPSAATPGTWRVHAVVDEAALIAELNEANNARASNAITLAPPPASDLDITAFSVPSTVPAGSTLAVQHTVGNVGTAASGAFTVRFYLSTDSVLDGADPLLGTRAGSGLAAGASTGSLTTNLSVASTTTPGTYRVIAMATLDSGTENDTSNNGAVSGVITVTAPGVPKPDLTVAALTMPATGATGRPLTISSTVKNAGPAPAGASTVRFYLSADATLDAGDVLLGSRALGVLAAGASSTGPTTVTIPANTSAPSSYRIIAVADALGQVTETDETNNTLVSSGQVAISLFRPDLTLTTLTIPATGATGRPLAISNTVRNAGPAPTGPFAVRFYLSSEDTLDAGDVLLGSRVLGGLAAGTSSMALTTLTIPANTSAPASYRVIAVADALDQQVEIDEGNNTLASSSTVAISLYRPELAIRALTTAASGATGRPLAITNTVRNSGPAPAGPFTIRLYLSTDGALDAGDVLLGSRTLGGLRSGAVSTAVTMVTIPAGTSAPASYQIIAVVDALGQQVELDETNNTTASAAFAVTLYRPDLGMTSMVMPASGAVGRPSLVRFTIANTGPAPSGVFTVRFYLSGDDTLDAGDVLLVTRTAGNLNPGTSRTETVSLTIPSDTAPGMYRVIAVTDPTSQLAEMDESNNLIVSAPMPITLYRPDLVMTAVSVPASGATGRPLAITNTVRNAGPAPAGPFAIRFYLSSDDTLDAGDVLLGTRMVGGLGAGAVSTAVSSLTIPANTSAPASYRVIAVADALEQQAELDETNNTLASATAVDVVLFRPDLVLATLSAPATGRAGKPLAVINAVKNVGLASAGPFAIRFYLSSDDTLDAGDVLLATRLVGGLPVGATSTATTIVTIPANTAVPAGYRIIGVVDALGQQAETDESNNVTLTAPLSLTPAS